MVVEENSIWVCDRARLPKSKGKKFGKVFIKVIRLNWDGRIICKSLEDNNSFPADDKTFCLFYRPANGIEIAQLKLKGLV